MKVKKFVPIAVVSAIFVMVLGTFLSAEETAKPGLITWNKYDDGLKLAAKAKKPIIVDFYTDWCGWCKKMDKTTYADSTISKYIKDHFIAVKINGESRETLNLPSGPSNGINVTRSFGVRGYPATWFLEADGKKIDYMSGFTTPDKFIYYLRFIGEGHYKSKSFQEFVQKETSRK